MHTCMQVVNLYMPLNAHHNMTTYLCPIKHISGTLEHASLHALSTNNAHKGMQICHICDASIVHINHLFTTSCTTIDTRLHKKVSSEDSIKDY